MKLQAASRLRAASSKLDKLYAELHPQLDGKEVGPAVFQVGMSSDKTKVTVRYDVTFRRMSPDQAWKRYLTTFEYGNNLLKKLSEQHGKGFVVDLKPQTPVKPSDDDDYSEYEQALGGFVSFKGK